MAIPTPQQTIISTGTDPALAEYGNALNSAAYISDGNVTYNITQIEQTVQNTSLTNNFNNTAGGSSGQVQFNSNGLLTGDAGFIYNPNNDTIVVSGNVLTGALSTTGNVTSAANVNANIVNATNLRTDNLQYANGDSYVFTAVTGNITFDEENIISTGNMYLQPNDANISSVDIYLTGSNDVHMAASQSADSLYLGNDNQFVRLNSTGAVDVTSYDSGGETSYSWSFDTTGALTLPGGTAYVSSSANTINIYSDTAELNGMLFYDTGVDIYAAEDFAIFANNSGDSHVWRYNADSTVTLPNSRLNVGAASIDIVSNNYSELLFENSDPANAAIGNVYYSYVYAQGDGTGSGIDVKDGIDYNWLYSSNGSSIFPAGISIQNNYKQYFNVIVNTDTGSGINLQININVTAAGEMQIVGISNGGSGYAVDDVVYVNGSAINGYNIIHDVYMIVTAVDEAGSIVNAGDLTVQTTTNRPYDGVKFAGGGVISGTDANGNVTIQTYDSEGPTNYNYAFTNQGTLEPSRSFSIRGHNNVGMTWFNNDTVHSPGDYIDTNIFARSACATISTSFYGIGTVSHWSFFGDGSLYQPGTISMRGDDRYYNVTVSTDTGSGQDLRVVLYLSTNGAVNLVDINNGGTSYNVGDVLYILGDEINGHDPANRIFLEVVDTGIGGVIEGVGQLAVTDGTGPKLGLQFQNFAAVQTDDNANGNLVIQSFNTTTEDFYRSTFDNTGNLTVPNYVIAPSFTGNLTNTDNIEIYTADTSGGSIDIYTDWASDVGVEVYLNHGNSVEIYTENGGYGWIFDNSGNLSTPGEVIISTDNAHGGANYAGILTMTNTGAGATNPNKYLRLNPTGALEIVNSAYNSTILQLTDSGNLTISGNVAGGNITTGGTIAATGRIQTTGSVPANNYGAAGDKEGMIAFDSDYIYYCFQDYVDNSTQCWNRTAQTTASW